MSVFSRNCIKGREKSVWSDGALFLCDVIKMLQSLDGAEKQKMSVSGGEVFRIGMVLNKS